MKSTYGRLEQMEARITEDGFTKPKGIGSDIPHFVLDYPAKDELQVRVYIKNMLKRTKVNIKEVNLFEFLLSFFEEDEIEELYEVCEEEGLRGLNDVFEPILNESKTMLQQFVDATEEADLIFITGVGTAHPFLRSSQLLKAIASKGYKKPIVLFYPGEFTGLRLKLFGILDYEDDYQLSRIS
ncbi:BREX protein BrxB domain-containing protein [Lentibacillus sp. N15]|uniref:BREX protein BrxB domain-containing protein n=1 Tax=Lentibacillus songyuanensis TaxID=3136161 RepID=UPI0031BB06C6